MEGIVRRGLRFVVLIRESWDAWIIIIIIIIWDGWIIIIVIIVIIIIIIIIIFIIISHHLCTTAIMRINESHTRSTEGVYVE